MLRQNPPHSTNVGIVPDSCRRTFLSSKKKLVSLALFYSGSSRDQTAFAPLMKILLRNSAKCIVGGARWTSSRWYVLWVLEFASSGLTPLPDQVVEGELKVSVGSENFSFPAGPFTHLGAGALKSDKTECDFDAEVVSIPVGGRVQMIVISHRVYVLSSVVQIPCPSLTRHHPL